MKTKIFKVLYLVILLIPYRIYSQENACRVLIPEISKEYIGKCKKGLAHGKGIAIGENRYEGFFRNGLPHGKGTYIWANGDVYEGYWKNGKRNGKGSFSTIEENKLKRIIGIWKNNDYVGEEKKPEFSVGHITNLTKYSINKIGDGNMVLATIYKYNKIVGPASDLIFNIDTGSSKKIGQSFGFENVNFPASINISYTHDGMFRVRFEAVINEPGVWEIRLYN